MFEQRHKIKLLFSPSGLNRFQQFVLQQINNHVMWDQTGKQRGCLPLKKKIYIYLRIIIIIISSMCLCANTFWKMASVLQQFRHSTETNQSEQAVHSSQWPRSRRLVLSVSSAVELQRHLSEILGSSVRVYFLWPNPIYFFFTLTLPLNHSMSFCFAGDPTSCYHETCQIRCWKNSWNGSVSILPGRRCRHLTMFFCVLCSVNVS